MTGSDRERELVNTLEACGWAAMRCPSSGSATTRDLPDVLAGNPGASVAIELKSGKGTTLYVDQQEVEALERFADRFGATPLLAARWTSQATGVKIWGVPPTDARKTDSGNYGLPVEDIQERAAVVWTPAIGDRGADEVWL